MEKYYKTQYGGWAKFCNEYNTTNSKHHNVFSFQFCVDTQIQLLKNVHLFGLDATHGLVKSLNGQSNAYLFVLTGIIPSSRNTFPLSFMLTNYTGKITINIG